MLWAKLRCRITTYDRNGSGHIIHIIHPCTKPNKEHARNPTIDRFFSSPLPS